MKYVDRIKNLNLIQKTLLIFLALMLIVFSVAYALNSSDVGIEYRNKILLLSNNGKETLYSGKIKGSEAVFIVTADKTVTFRYGDKQYGPYTAIADESAAPKDHDYTTGIVLYEGDNVIFRGGYLRTDTGTMLFDNNGSLFGHSFLYTEGNGNFYDSNGNIIDKMEPSASEIIELIYAPELKNSVEMLFWFYGFVISIIIAISILFADELFRFSMSFSIKNAHKAEPSELEIASRYTAWIIAPIIALACFIVGLV